MHLLIVVGVILVVCWCTKLLLFLSKGGKPSLHLFVWTCVWTGKFPSTHSAVLAGVMYSIWRTEGLSPLFGFSVVISAMNIYTLLENRKRYELLVPYLSQSNDPSLQSIAAHKKLDEFEGHTLTEVIAGLALGLVVAVLLELYV